MKTGTIIPNMSYADLAATLLAAVGVIVAIFGGVLAIAAVWGFAQMKREAVESATSAALSELREQIENGPLRVYIRDEIERLIVEEFNSKRMDQRILQRVDKITLGNEEDDLLKGQTEEGQ
jgi:ethanolamine ammonia-lyase large subunit